MAEMPEGEEVVGLNTEDGLRAWRQGGSLVKAELGQRQNNSRRGHIAEELDNG